jgi:hypothetical protein
MKLPEFRILAAIPHRSAIIVFVAISLLAVLAVKCQLERESVLETYLELRKQLPKGKLPPHLRDLDDYFNREINRRPALLKKKIEGDVNDALAAYEAQEKAAYRPLMTNKNILNYAASLPFPQRYVLESAIYYELPDGTMGIRGAWTKAHPDEIKG